METNGFVFESTDTQGLDQALNRAMSTWHNDKSGFREVQVGGSSGLHTCAYYFMARALTEPSCFAITGNNPDIS